MRTITCRSIFYGISLFLLCSVVGHAEAARNHIFVEVKDTPVFHLNVDWGSPPITIQQNAKSFSINFNEFPTHPLVITWDDGEYIYELKVPLDHYRSRMDFDSDNDFRLTESLAHATLIGRFSVSKDAHCLLMYGNPNSPCWKSKFKALESFTVTRSLISKPRQDTTKVGGDSATSTIAEGVMPSDWDSGVETLLLDIKRLLALNTIPTIEQLDHLFMIDESVGRFAGGGTVHTGLRSRNPALLEYDVLTSNALGYRGPTSILLMSLLKRPPSVCLAAKPIMDSLTTFAVNGDTGMNGIHHFSYKGTTLINWSVELETDTFGCMYELQIREEAITKSSENR